MPSQFDDPKTLKGKKVCLNKVSKNLQEGSLNRTSINDEACATPDCKTRKLTHKLSLPVASHTCDSTASKVLNGKIVIDGVNELVTAKLPAADGRGIHSGNFVWTGTVASGVVVKGTMNGLNNIGPHRKPFIGNANCEQNCDTRLVMEGRFSGKVTAAKNQQLIGCEVVADYRLRLNTSEDGAASTLNGTLEGLLICLCQH